MFTSSTDPEANNYKLDRYLQRLAGSLVPSGVAAIEREYDPAMSATYDILDGIKSRIPGFSDDLPPRRNVFGEVIVLEGGIGPDIMSPVYTSTVKEDKVSEEIVRQQAPLSMPLRVINGIELNPEQYDKLILLTAGEGLRGAEGKNLKSAYKDLFAKDSYKRASDGPEGGKALLIRSVATAYKDAAKAQMLKEYPELASQVRLERTRKARMLSGQQ